MEEDLTPEEREEIKKVNRLKEFMSQFAVEEIMAIMNHGKISIVLVEAAKAILDIGYGEVE